MILNSRRELVRENINVDGSHLTSVLARLKSALKLTGLMLTRLFWLTPIASDSLLIYEGDTVTVLGVLKYDT